MDNNERMPNDEINSAGEQGSGVNETPAAETPKVDTTVAPEEAKPASKKKEDEEFVPPHVGRKFGIAVVTLFMVFLLLPTIAWGVLRVVSVFNPAIMETLDFDTGEQRALAKFPTSFNPQTVASEIENWYNDHLPFRSLLYKTQETLENALEAPYNETIRPALLEFFHPASPSGPETPGSEVIEIPDLTESEHVDETIETETLPQFDTETEEQGPQTCQHVYSDEQVIIQAATCTEFGIAGYQCQNCDYIGNKQYTHKAAHNYVISGGEDTRCGSKYEEVKTCSACGDSSSKTLVKKHEVGKKLDVVKPSYESYGYTLVRCKNCETEYRTELSNKLYDTTYFTPLRMTDKAFEGRSQWLFYRLDNSEAYYQATNLPDDKELERYASVFQQLNDICKQKGIQLQISVWPNKDQVYSEYMPTMEVVSEYKRVERIVDYVTENTDVKMIYPINELMAVKPYWDLYWPLDTHWNNAGAFIGYQAMLESLGFETTSMVNLPVRILKPSDKDYKKIVRDSNTSLLYAPKGDIQGMVGNSKYPEQCNYIVEYRPDVEVLSQEGNNGAGDTRHTTSNGPNDLNFVMLADSYRVMQLTYLEKDFTDCFLTHRNRVGDSDVIQAVRNADVLVIAAVERLETNIVDTAVALIKILSAD